MNHESSHSGMGRIWALCALVLVLAPGCAWVPSKYDRDGGPTYQGHIEWKGRFEVRRGDTLSAIAAAYRVNWRELASANNISAPYTIHPGQRLRVPRTDAVYVPPPSSHTGGGSHSGGSSSSDSDNTADDDVYAARIYRVREGDTPRSIARSFSVTVDDILRANGESDTRFIRPGNEIVLPPRPTIADGANDDDDDDAYDAPHSSDGDLARVELASFVPLPRPKPGSGRTTTPLPERVEPVSAPGPATGDAVRQFSWPVRGEIISAYGTRANGKANDGINIAAAEGTPVKSAADGVVRYAGNELRGFGKLLLIEHAGGFITAYAHNSELLVRRGDSVRRGQTIARVGRTGNVSEPQLHFEVRKGTEPLDPRTMLPR